MIDQYWGCNKESTEKGEKVKLTVHDFASETKSHAATDFNVVETSHNRIYFYSGVTRPKVLQLN